MSSNTCISLIAIGLSVLVMIIMLGGALISSRSSRWEGWPGKSELSEEERLANWEKYVFIGTSAGPGGGSNVLIGARAALHTEGEEKR